MSVTVGRGSPSLVSGTRSTSPVGTGAAVGAATVGAPAAARSTSSATTRPSGPVPLSEPSSIPRSRAILRDRSRRGRGGDFFFGRRLWLRGGQVGHLFPLLADDGDGGADIGLALGDGDLEQDAGGLGLDLLGHLVGVELVERLALFDCVALRLEPLDDRPGLHALPEARKLDLVRHRAAPSSGSPRARPWRAGRRTPPSPARTAAV